MAKDRSYANPVIAKLSFFEKDAPIKVEVSEYQVTDKHVILTRKQGDSKVTKYIAIAALKTFEFDAPMDYTPKLAAVPMWTGNGIPINVGTTYNASTDGAPVFTPNPIVARNRPVAVRPSPDVEVSTSEKKVIEKAMSGAGIAGMS